MCRNVEGTSWSSGFEWIKRLCWNNPLLNAFTSGLAVTKLCLEWVLFVYEECSKKPLSLFYFPPCRGHPVSILSQLNEESRNVKLALAVNFLDQLRNNFRNFLLIVSSDLTSCQNALIFWEWKILQIRCDRKYFDETQKIFGGSRRAVWRRGATFAVTCLCSDNYLIRSLKGYFIKNSCSDLDGRHFIGLP